VRDRLDLNAQAQPIDEPRLRALEWVKGSASDDPARPPIRNTEDHPASAFIGEGDAVLDQILELEAVLGLLELEVLVLRLGHPAAKVVQTRHYPHYYPL